MTESLDVHTAWTLLFALIPTLHNGTTAIVPSLGLTAGAFILKFGLFIGGCHLFSRYLDPRVTAFTARL